MFTIFSTPKPFKGHTAIIQRNAIKSWTLLHPDCEVILIGDDEGTAEVAQELCVRHEPKVLRNEHGTPYLNDIFDRAQEIATHDVLCYSNCDIILMSDFSKAVSQVLLWNKAFLAVGRRWNADITEPYDFQKSDWEQHLQILALEKGERCIPGMIDYFAFPRGTYYKKIAPFVIGRPFWDNWLIWKTRSLKIPVIDISPVVVAVHQNHDYSHFAKGRQEHLKGKEATHHYELAGWMHLYTTNDATHKLTSKGIRRNFIHWFMMLERRPHYIFLFIWSRILGIIIITCRLMGLRKERIKHLTKRCSSLIGITPKS